MCILSCVRYLLNLVFVAEILLLDSLLLLSFGMDDGLPLRFHRYRVRDLRKRHFIEGLVSKMFTLSISNAL